MNRIVPVVELVSVIALCAAPAMAGAPGGPGGGPDAGPVLINEIRIDQPGSDNDEYFELSGLPGTSLQGLAYVVIGDGTGGSGVIESVTPLQGSIGPSGLFVVAENTFTLGTPDLAASLGFENSDNVTHLLVEGLQVGLGEDVDTDDDCVIDGFPWTFVLDQVALKENDTGECLYGSAVVGPDGVNVPGHVYRCPLTGAWAIGDFSLGVDDTPTLQNPVCPQFVFGLPHRPLGQAILSPGPEGRLRVSNLGSSGKDGVSISLGDEPDGEARRYRQEFGPQAGQRHLTTTSPAGTPVHDIVLDTTPRGLMAVLIDTNPLLPTGVRVEAYLGGALVQTFNLPPGQAAPLIVSNIGSSGKDGVSIELGSGCCGSNFNVDSFFDICYRVSYSHNVGGAAVQADQMRVFVENPANPPVGGIAQVDITTFNTPFFELSGALLGPFDLFHGALGESHMQMSNGQLIVSNIGSSGKDGVSMVMPGGGSSDHMSAILNIHDEDESMSMDAEIHGFDDTGGTGPLAQALISLTNSIMSITPTFLVGNDPPLQVELLSGEIVVGGTQTTNGATTDLGAPTPGTAPLRIAFSADTGTLEIDFSQPVEAFGAFGNTLRVRTTGSFRNEMISMQLRCRNFGSMDITGASSTAQPVFIFGGLPHQPLGQANIGSSGKDGVSLRVSNLGSSGKDGVRVSTGGGVAVEKFNYRQEFGPMSGTRRITSIGPGGPYHDVQMAMDAAVGLLTVTADTSLFANSSMRVQVLRGSQIVGDVVLPSPQANTPLVVSNIGSSGKDGVSMELHGGGDFNVDSFFDIDYQIDYSHDVGGNPIIGDTVRFFLQGLPPGYARQRSLQLIDVTAVGPPDFDLTGNALGPFDLFHSTLGEVHMTLNSSGHLVVSNIGSSGKDGVRQTYPGGGGGGGRIALEAIVEDSFSSTMSMDMDVFTSDGTGGGGGGGAIWLNASINLSNLVMSILPTFFETGDVPTEVQFYSNGTLNGTTTLQPGASLDLSSPPGTRVTHLESSLDGDGLRIQFNGELGFGAGLSADDVRFNPLATGGTAGGTVQTEMISMDLHLSSLSSFSIIDSQGDLCFGDTDDNGAVDVDDLVSVILDWGTNGAANNGDVNGSGLVDVDDLVAVILAWGACP